MIAKGTPHANGAVLGRYLVTGKDDERAELWELRGFASTEIVDAFRSVHVIARGTKCASPFFHVYVRNPEGETLDRREWEYTANRIESILGLADQPRAIAFHIAENGHAHMHVAWSRIDPETLKAKPLPFYKRRLKTASREIEQRLGLTLVPNERESSIKYAPKRAEEEQARRLGLNIHEIRENIRSCFERSDCGQSFQSALSHVGMVLARGDSRDFLVVDRAGGVHALSKRILDVSAAEIRVRLADLSSENLPTLDQVRAAVTQPQTGAPGAEPPTPYAPTVESAGATDVADSEPERHIDSGQRTTTGSKGQQEKNVGLLEQDPICEPSPSAEPQLPIARANSETHESQPPAKADAKPPSLAENIRSLFRAAIKSLTRRGPDPPQPKKARRKDETARGFEVAARAVLGRVARLPVFQQFHQNWDAFTWLKIWEYDNSEGMDCHQDTVQNANSDFSPHP